MLLVSDDFAIPLIGHWELLGFAQDLIAVLALVSLGVFAQIRLKNAPEKLGRRSRFKGSHLGGAWLVLFMIFNVIWTMFLFRGAASATGNLPYDSGAFVSVALGNAARRAVRGRPPRARGDRAAAPHRRDAGVPGDRAQQQAPPHLRGAAQRAVQAAAGRARRRQAAHARPASRSPSTTSRTWTRTPGSASARSRTSRGRACSTSRPAPSAAAARTSARRGTPRSRSRPRC